MDHNETIHQLMDQYIMGQLSGKAKLDFEKELQTNQQFAEAFGLHQQLAAGIRTFGNRQLKNELKEIHQKVVAPSAKIRPMWFRYAAAAGVLVLLAVGVWLFMQPNKANELFAAYYEPYRISLGVRGEPNTEQLRKAEEAYFNKDYANAAILLEGQIKEEYNSQVYLAAGISYLELGGYEKAIDRFNVIIEKNDPFLKDQANWYTALTYLRCNKKQKAIPYLKQLADDKNADKHREAKVLLENLD